ncbi:N-acetyltransferase [Corynebacterium aquatimens]|uniref:GNAT family N-acetyltransferase n=1 Tax=Corynebacterium TaxID=1716 RepID=UPI001F1A1B58|nr:MULTISPECIES: GNAT family N-acetyltransferase [Corynebacterium]QYH19284.1 N-acetyltransferase [Corynebacterium aquatimens]UIZ91821.1 N-acetyltransferase [Corynebacterium sp. CNCTC7651]
MSENNTNVAINEAKQRYELFVDGELAGFADYSDLIGVRVLPHTVVDPKFRGRGLSKPLIKYALDDIREQGMGVVPMCSAVSAFIDANPEYRDMV